MDLRGQNNKHLFCRFFFLFTVCHDVSLYIEGGKHGKMVNDLEHLHPVSTGIVYVLARLIRAIPNGDI